MSCRLSYIYIYIYSWKLGWSRSRYMGWSRTRTGHASIRAWSFNSWLTSQFFVLLMLLMLLFFHRWLNKYTIHWQFMKFEILWFLWTSTKVSFLIEMLNLPPLPLPNTYLWAPVWFIVHEDQLLLCIKTSCYFSCCFYFVKLLISSRVPNNRKIIGGRWGWTLK